MYSRSHCFALIASNAAPRLMTRLKKNKAFSQRTELDGVVGDGERKLDIVELIAGGMFEWFSWDEI